MCVYTFNTTICSKYYIKFHATTLNIFFRYFITDTVEQWYVNWRDLALHRSKQNNESLQLREALRHCRLETVYKILANEPLSPQEYY